MPLETDSPGAWGEDEAGDKAEWAQPQGHRVLQPEFPETDGSEAMPAFPGPHTTAILQGHHGQSRDGKCPRTGLHPGTCGRALCLLERYVRPASVTLL